MYPRSVKLAPPFIVSIRIEYALLVMLLNQGMSFHERLGSMNDYTHTRLSSVLPIVPSRSMLLSETHANGAGHALVLLDVLTLLHFGSCIVVNRLHPHVLLPASELWSVHGDEETLDTTCFGMLDVLPGDFSVAVNVELEEEVLARCGVVDDIIEGTGGKGSNLARYRVSAKVQNEEPMENEPFE